MEEGENNIDSIYQNDRSPEGSLSDENNSVSYDGDFYGEHIH